MQANPVIEKQNEFTRLNNERAKNKKTYPVRVCCVVDDLSDSNPDILKIKAHAHSSGASFLTRIYDSRKYNDDCYQITRLPAFHIYINGLYNRTFYPNTRPLQHVDEAIAICIKRERRRQEKKERWTKLYDYFASLIKRLTHRETRMERYKREQIEVADMIDTSRLKDIRKNTVTISEWN